MQYLAETENYKLTSEHETVYLHFKNSDKPPVIIGDFYGDPDGAFFFGNYAIMYGCGIIIYKLQEPFTAYNYDTACPLYSEFHRNPRDIWWVETAYASGMDDGDAETFNTQFFRFVMYGDDNKIGVYRMNIKTHEVELLE